MGADATRSGASSQSSKRELGLVPNPPRQGPCVVQRLDPRGQRRDGTSRRMQGWYRSR